MADPKRVDSNSGGLTGVAQLLDLLGGQKSSSTTTSDTSDLKGLLAQLQGTNYDDVLKSIFTQAGGQIPGLTAGLSNSIGARTGGNSAVATALGKLLESTAIKGTETVARLQQGNQQLQGNVASAIAQGNKSTKTTSGTNTGKAAQNLAILQLGSKLLGSDGGKALLTKGKGLFNDLFGSDTTPGADLTSAGAASFGSDIASPGFGDIGGFSANDVGTNLGFGAIADGGNVFGDALASSSGDVAADVGGGIADNVDFQDLGQFFANGGLVGRDGVSGDGDKPDTGYAELRKWEMDEGSFPKSAATKQPANAEGTPQAYADGGVVRAGGGRRSSAPTYNPQAPTPSAAVQSPLAALNPRGRQELAFDPLELESGPGVSPSSASEAAGAGTSQSVAVGNAVGQAAANAVMSAVVGPVATMAFNNVAAPTIGMAPNQSALSQAISAIANALGLGNNSGVNPDGTTDTSPTATGTSSVADAANADSGNGTSSGADSGGGAGTGGSTSAGGTGGPGDADSGGTGYAMGGQVSGPGNGTSDSVHARLSKGEYVIPADVVNQLGVRFFDELKNHFHTPSEVQNAQ